MKEPLRHDWRWVPANQRVAYSHRQCWACCATLGYERLGPRGGMAYVLRYSGGAVRVPKVGALVCPGRQA